MTDLEKALAEGGQPVETDLSRALAEGGTPVAEDALPAAPDTRSFLDRAGDKIGQSFSNFGHTVASAARGAVDLVSPISKTGDFQVPFGQLADPAYRHELERGISDTVTGGLAEKAANAVSPEFAASAAPDAAAAPDARALGNAVGVALPSPFKEAGGAASKLVPGTGPLAAGARGIVGYEASAIPQAAVSAPSGHRLESIAEAATDPASLVTAGAVPATISFLEKRLSTAAAKAPEVQEAAKRRAVKDLGQDITSAEGPKAKVTDQKRIAEVNDRLYDLAERNPELRHAFSEPAEKALPKIQRFKDTIAKPLDSLYDAIDEHTGGGLDAAQVVKQFRDMAKEDARSVAGLDDAARLEKLADRFEKVYITDRAAAAPEGGARPLATGEPPPKLRPLVHEGPSGQEPPPGLEPPGDFEAFDEKEPGHKTVGDKTKVGGKGSAEPPPDLDRAIADLQKLRENAVGVSAKAIDEQIASLEKERGPAAHAQTVVAPAPTAKIPTSVFRREVTDLLKKSDSIMGGIEGTPRFEALQHLYDAGKKIIDRHIDGSGLPPDQIAQVRDINNGYFLASRAEEAIKSRGWKEANQPGFHIAHGVKQALHSGGMTAAGYAAMHPQAIPGMAAYGIASHTIPKAAKAVNLTLARGAYGRAIDNLIGLAKRLPRPEFVGQAARAGLPAREAARIYDAAHAQGAAP